MSYTVLIRNAAERDVSEAQDWYEQEAELGSEFFEEFNAAVKILSETPFIYQEVHRNVRRAVLHRFPYLIWYVVNADTVTVIACTHAKTGPRKLRRKLR